MRLPALVQPFLGDIRGFRVGFWYVIQGAKMLLSDRAMYPYIVGPVLVNAMLFIGFVIAGFALMGRFFGGGMPESWWGFILFAAAFVASLVALLFVSASLFAFLGSIVCAPFYEAIAAHLTRKLGGIVIDRPWWHQVRAIVSRSTKKWWWYMLIQVALLILYIAPLAVGPFAYSALGFLTTAFFLAWEYLDMSFDFRGLSFEERRAWCLKNKGLLFGFGTAVFIGFAIPLLNLLVPVFAVAGSILMYYDHDADLAHH